MTVAHLLEAAGLRLRRDQIEALPGPPPGGGLGAAGAGSGAPGVELQLVRGAWVDRETLAGVAREVDETGVEVVDLVPGDLPVERALRLLRRVDPERLEVDPRYAPGGAHQVLAGAGAGAGAGSRRADVPAMVEATVAAQRRSRASALRLAPRLRATPWSPDDRWREIEALVAALPPRWPRRLLAPLVVGLETTHLAVMTVGLAVTPLPAVAALASWSAQPVLAFAGSPPGPRCGPPTEPSPAGRPGDEPALRPPGWARAGLLRLPRAWAGNVATLRAGHRARRSHRLAAHSGPTGPTGPTGRGVGRRSVVSAAPVRAAG